jgi:hypothetical protein
MSIQDLSPGTMLEHSRRWTDPTEPACQAIANLPTACAALPELRASDTELALVTSPSATPAQPTTEDQLTASLAEADGLFDTNVSGANLVLKGFLVLAPAPIRASIQAAYNKLLPRGVGVTKATYRDEAGEAKRLSLALDPATLAVLTSIKLPWDNKTLADVFADIIAAANRLGTLDSERERLRQEAASPTAANAAANTTTAKPPTVASAKRRWVKAVKMLRQLVEVDKASPATYALLFATLDADIAKTLPNHDPTTPPATHPKRHHPAPAHLDDANRPVERICHR